MKLNFLKNSVLPALILVCVLAEGALLGRWSAERHVARQLQEASLEQERTWRACLELRRGYSESERVAAVEDCLEEQRGLIQAEPLVRLEGGGKGTVSIANASESKLRYTVSIRRQDNGEEIYRSGMLEPGYLLLQIQGAAELEKGIYPCILLFEGYPMGSDLMVGKFVRTVLVAAE